MRNVSSILVLAETALIIFNLSGLVAEGAFYAWTTKEIDEVLKAEPEITGVPPSTLLKERYGAKLSGNVDAKSDIQGELTGKVRR